jgi:Gpi18-like mannosyltransferase
MGTMVVIKQIMILADIFIAAITFYICKINNVDWKKYVFAYLLLPFSWYLSSIWGQSDQLSFLFFIIAFSLITSKKYSILSPLFFAIAGNLKPNCILLLPLFLFIWYRHKISFGKLIIGGLIALIFSFWTIS